MFILILMISTIVFNRFEVESFMFGGWRRQRDCLNLSMHVKSSRHSGGKHLIRTGVQAPLINSLLLCIIYLLYLVVLECNMEGWITVFLKTKTNPTFLFCLSEKIATLFA